MNVVQYIQQHVDKNPPCSLREMSTRKPRDSRHDLMRAGTMLSVSSNRDVEHIDCEHMDPRCARL
jgi:hypothetical protein